MKNPKVFVVLLAVLLTACVNLKHVKDFASSSEKSLGDFKNIPYSWQQYCIDKCNLAEEEKILSGAEKFTPSAEPTCDCTLAQERDKDAAKAYNLLILYFTGLEKLSDTKKFVYKTDSLTNALTKIKAISDTSLKKPINTIAGIVLNMATQVYREHALETLLDQADKPVNALLLNLEQHNSNVRQNYKTYYERFVLSLENKYKSQTPVGTEEQLADYKANKVVRDQLKQVIQKIDDFNANLEKIRLGHQKLSAERMNLKDKDLIEYLYTQASALKTNISKL